MWITIDRTADLPLIRQVYQQIHQQILSGDLAAGDKLPSSRVLAAELQVSRNIILEAYELLFAEGYLASVPGLGTYVAAGAEMREISPEAATAAVTEAGLDETAAPLLNLQCGLPDLRLFPAGKWHRIVMETMNSAGLHLVAVFKDWEFTEDRMAQLQAAGLDLSPPVERHAMVKGRYSRHLILGYAHLDEAEIQAGVALLGRTLRV